MDQELFTLWQTLATAPYHFPVKQQPWSASMLRDIDSDGRKLFSGLQCQKTAHGFVQYGTTAFGFDENGEIITVTAYHNYGSFMAGAQGLELP